MDSLEYRCTLYGLWTNEFNCPNGYSWDSGDCQGCSDYERCKNISYPDEGKIKNLTKKEGE